MNTFAEHLAEDRRLVILLLLIEAQGVANESVLRSGLEAIGHISGLTRERLREDLQFLEECGCIRQQWYGDKVVVAHLKKRGTEIAQGRIIVEGIKRPSIGE
jgi:hypothetical protein